MLKSVSGFSFGSIGYNKVGTTYLGKATYNRFWRNPPDLTFELQYPFPINLLHPVAVYQTAPPTYPTQRPLATCDLVHAKKQNHHNPQLISWGLTTLNLVSPVSDLFHTNKNHTFGHFCAPFQSLTHWQLREIRSQSVLWVNRPRLQRKRQEIDRRECARCFLNV